MSGGDYYHLYFASALARMFWLVVGDEGMGAHNFDASACVGGFPPTQRRCARPCPQNSFESPNLCLAFFCLLCFVLRVVADPGVVVGGLPASQASPSRTFRVAACALFQSPSTFLLLLLFIILLILCSYKGFVCTKPLTRAAWPGSWPPRGSSAPDPWPLLVSGRW
jgi:hypothetical protein